MEVLQNIPKVYVLTKTANVESISFQTETPVPRASRLLVNVYSNLVTAGVIGTMTIQLNIGGAGSFDIFGGPCDSGAYGGTPVIIQLAQPFNVPNEMRLRVLCWDDAGNVVDNFAGLITVKIQYEQPKI